jgi:5-methylcytosine-specific restriction protein A
MPNEITGRYLNELWQVGVDHALYSHDGTWYHQLRRFPGALFDSQGYVIFQTEPDFRNCPQLRISQDVGCPSGISTIPGYVKVGELVSFDIAPPSQPDRVHQTVSRIVRDTAMSSAIKLRYENTCQICSVTVDLGHRTYSEAHHIRPLGSPHDGPDETG